MLDILKRIRRLELTELISRKFKILINISCPKIVFSVLDMNECLYDNGGCSQLCSNNIGSYYCSCPWSALYRLNPDKHTCDSE